jgi:AcrR family transcriptional regulator
MTYDGTNSQARESPGLGAAFFFGQPRADLQLQDLETMTAQTTATPDLIKSNSILESAVQVFAREGFRGTDVQVIADRAGVGKGTVYRYFGDKQDLFWETVYWVLDKLHRYLEAAVSAHDRPLDQLRAACVAYGQFFEDNADYLEIFVLDRAEFRGRAPQQRQQRHEEMIQRFTEIIERGTQAGEIAPLDARMTVLLLGSTLHGAAVCAAFPKVKCSVAEMTAYAGENFIRGIRAETEQEGGTS